MLSHSAERRFAEGYILSVCVYARKLYVRTVYVIRHRYAELATVSFVGIRLGCRIVQVPFVADFLNIGRVKPSSTPTARFGYKRVVKPLPRRQISRTEALVNGALPCSEGVVITVVVHNYGVCHIGEEIARLPDRFVTLLPFVEIVQAFIVVG